MLDHDGAGFVDKQEMYESILLAVQWCPVCGDPAFASDSLVVFAIATSVSIL